MTSFLSDENINYLQYELRKIYPENKWMEIQMSIKQIVISWYKANPALDLIYYEQGITGLNRKFLEQISLEKIYSDSIQNDIYYNSLFNGIPDPSIDPFQRMPRYAYYPMVQELNPFLEPKMKMVQELDPVLQNYNNCRKNEYQKKYKINTNKYIKPMYQPGQFAMYPSTTNYKYTQSKYEFPQSGNILYPY